MTLSIAEGRPPDRTTMASGNQSLAQFLRDQRDAIVARFVVTAERKDLAPSGLARSLLVDHIPRFIDEIVSELAAAEPVRMTQEAADVSETARQHGEQRWLLGYDLAGVIREYGVLRHCLMEAAKEAALTPTIQEFDLLAKCLSVGVAEAATEYVRFRDEQLVAQRANLEFIAEAGQILSASLDYRSTPSRLTSLIVPRLADCCLVRLDGDADQDMHVAHVDPAKVATVRELYRRFPPASSAHQGHPLLRVGEPQLIQNVGPALFEEAAENAEHLALLKVFNAHSWVIVPLKVQESVFGTLALAYSDSERRYEADDLVLATELALRGAVAIDNARLYEMAQRERSRVEAATRAKDEFVAMVSHELRTPLNAMLGWIRLLRSGALSDEKREHALAVIERNANAQNQLVGDLLDISRILTGKVRINPSQLDLGTVLDIAIEGIRPAALAKRIDLVTEVDRTSSVMRGDGDRLQQVVWNLVGNAVKFTPKGGTVNIRLRRVESDLELVVQDTGEGIAPGFLPHVFDSFRQSDSSASRPHGGLGIGLSIAKHLVELHGGTIEAHSPGLHRGATFVVRLPVSPLVSTTLGVSRVPATQQDAQAPSLPTGLEGVSVLVVDDEPDARELVGYVLESCGAEVRLAGSAAEAVELLDARTPTVLISDVGMPGKDGYGLIRSVRTLADEGKRNVPAIALTAFARNEDRKRALVEGFNLHLAKPVEPGALVAAVAALVGRVMTPPPDAHVRPQHG